MNSDVKLLESKENRDIKKVPLLLEEIKKEHGLAFTIKDTKKVSPMKLGELTINVPTGLKIQRSMNMEPVA
jgi:hypothetical protein